VADRSALYKSAIMELERQTSAVVPILIRLLQPTAVALIHVYEVHFGKDKRGVDLISDSLPFGRVWHDWPEAVANGNWLCATPQPLT
jgi:hypothetical protein